MDTEDTSFIVEKILPTGFVHLIAGPVGMGKTTLLIQLFEALRDGGDWLGQHVNPYPVLYIAADRSRKETLNTIKRMDSDVEICIHSLKDSLASMNVLPTIEEIIARHAKAGQLVVVEPLGFFVTDGKGGSGDTRNYLHVAKFLVTLERQAQKSQVTVLGSMHTSKTKPGDRYENPRERIMGSAAWGGFASTLILVEPDDAKDVLNCGREIIILPRNGAPMVSMARVNKLNGRLEPTDKPVDKVGLFELWIFDHDTFTSEQAVDWAKSHEVTERTLFRWLKDGVEDGSLVKNARGNYELSPSKKLS